MHHYVIGGCHPGNVSFTDVHLRISGVVVGPHGQPKQALVYWGVQLKKSVCVFKACGLDSWQFKWIMGNHLLHIWILSFQSSSSQNASVTDCVCWPNQTWTRNVYPKTSKRQFLRRRTWVSQLRKCPSFLPASPTEVCWQWLLSHMVPENRGTQTRNTFITGKAIQSIEVAFSATIREF